MVRLTKIYTKTGDDGTTGLASGARVRKDDLCVEAYGTVDEANCFIGECVIAAKETNGGDVEARGLPRIEVVLEKIQHDLFDLGADMATPITPDEQAGTRLRIVEKQTKRLEDLIDKFNEGLAPLSSFVLPGGSHLAASLHKARAVTRRAERIAVSLQAARAAEVNQEAIKYLNRLSDLLFVLSRVANEFGTRDVLWVPGANRHT